MKHARDEQLGRALTSLDVPDHGEGFWDDLADRLRTEGAKHPSNLPPAGADPGTGDDGAPVVSAPPGPLEVTHLRRGAARAVRSDQRWLASAAVAAVVALVVAAGVVLAGGPDRSSAPPVATTPTSDEEPGTTEEPPLAVPASLSAEITVTLEDGSERRFNLVADRNGSRLVRDLDSGELSASDVPDGEDVIVFPAEGEDFTAYRRRGVPAGGPNSRFGDAVSGTGLVAHALALVATGDPSVTEVEHLGRPAWRLDTDVTPNAIGGGPDEATVVVDQTTGLLLFLEERLGGQPVRTIDVTALETSEEPAGPDAFDVDGDAEVVDEGFERISIEALRAGAVGDAAVEPAAVPDGFELASVDVHPGSGPSTGPEGMNPPSEDAVVLVYRRGWEELVVTSWRSGGDPDVWDDPYGGEGLVVEAEPATIEGGALDGTDVEIVVDPATTPHLWGVNRDLVITVSSTARLTPSQLLEVAGSLERIR